MKGDFTRFSHRPANRYTAVLKQQGRVDLDADWNEQIAIQEDLARIEARDVIGRCGVPTSGGGFGIGVAAGGRDLTISPGRIYVEGLLCRLEPTLVPAALSDRLDQVLIVPAGAPWVVDGHPFAAGQQLEVVGEGGVPARGVTIVAVDSEARTLTVDPAIPEFRGIPGLRLRRPTTYLVQPDLPDPADLAPAAGRTDLVYLDVWQRHVTAIEDPDIREVALGGPDTTTRVQTVCQVKVLRDVGDVPCDAPLAAWARLTAPSGGRLTTAVVPDQRPEDPCLLGPEGGYRGLENRLYRVEIHEGSAVGAPSFKWSRDNGSVVFAIEEFVAATRLRVARLGRDEVLALRVGDWVEVLGDATELRGEPGTLTQIAPNGVDEAGRTLSLSDDVSRHAGEFHPKVRRWDQPSDAIAIAQGHPAGLVDLEDGIQIRFTGGDYRPGDAWVFAARTATRDVETLIEAPPRVIQHHFCRLALVSWRLDAAGNPTADVRDCRRPFPPLTELPTVGTCCTVSVGDGIRSVGDFTDIQAAIDAVPQGGRVCILPGDYPLRQTVVIQRGRLILAGCGRQARIIGPRGEPAFLVEGAAEVALESLYVEATARRGAILAVGSPGLRVADCQVFNRTLRPIPDRLTLLRRTLAAGPALLAIECDDLTVTGNRFFGLPAIGLRGRLARVVANRVTAGGVWVGDGAADVLIAENEIAGGEGPGVILGQLVGGADPSERATGVRGVVIAENQIRQMAGSGVSTVARGEDDVPLGEIEDVEIRHNRIVACAGEGTVAAIDPDAAGGIVLRDTARVRIHGNYLTGNGPEQAACGVFVRDCRGLEVTDNTILDNGTAVVGPRVERCVDYAAMQAGAGPNPRTEGGATVEVFGFRGERPETTRIIDVRVPAPFIGLDPGFRTEIRLPNPSRWVEIIIVHFAWPARVEAFDAGGASLGVREMEDPQGIANRLRIEAEGIVRVVIESSENELLLVGFCFEAEEVVAPASFQVGIAALEVTGGEQVLGERLVVRPGAPAAAIHGNVVVCPQGHALIAVALGPLAVADNSLVSQNARAQPEVPSWPDELNALIRATVGVAIYDVGRTAGVSESIGPVGVATHVHTFRAEGGRAAAAALRRLADGRVLFHDNQVTVQATAGGGRQTSAAVGVWSFDDVSLQDNQFLVEVAPEALFASVVAIGPTVRASGNRFTELPGSVPISYFAQGSALNAATANQATHCIVLNGAQVVDAGNQIQFPSEICRRFDRRFRGDDG